MTGSDRMGAALGALKTFLAEQEARGTPEETDRSLTADFRVREPRTALEQGAALARDHAATVVLRFSLPTGNLTLTLPAEASEWEPEPRELRNLLTSFAGNEDRPRICGTELVAAAGELASATEADGDISLAKAPWLTDLSTSDAEWIWIGPRAEAFTAWVARVGWREFADLALTGPTALVLIENSLLTHHQVSPNLAIARPSKAKPITVPDELWRGRLGSGEHPSVWRAALLDPPNPVPIELRRILCGVATAAAADALAEERQAGEPQELRPLRTRSRTWAVGKTPLALDAEQGAATRALARWVVAGGTQMHLSVARRIAAAEIPAFDDVTRPEGLVAAADLGLRVSIDTTVANQLARQEEFEKRFLELDRKVSDARSAIAALVDDVTTRALTAALAIAIAALASPRVRGWPAAVAGLLIALYLGLSIVRIRRQLQPEIHARLKTFDDEIRGKRAALSEPLAKSLETALAAWKTQLDQRLCGSSWILVALAVAILGAGLAGAIAGDGDPPPKPLTVTVLK